MDTAKPYRLPDPKKNPEAFLVLLYKTLKRIPFDDRGWDKIYFARCMKRTKELLENITDVRMAAQCMQDLKLQFEGDGLNWTIETMLQYSFQWRADHMKMNAEECVRDLAGAYGKEAPMYLQMPKKEVLPPAPRCHHPRLERKEGEETKCPDCPLTVYTPKPEEMQKLRESLRPRQVPAA